MASTQVTLIGNLVSDPKLTYMTNGSAKIDFSVACSEYWTDKEGERQEKTSFTDVVAWRNLAEEAGNILEKGMGVIVIGRVEQQTWEDKETGAKRSRIQFLADHIGARVGGLASVERKQRSEDGAKKATSKPAPKKVVEDEEPF